MLRWSDIRYFQPHEFDSQDEKGSGEKKISLDLVAQLDRMRAELGFPFVISSGYRTPSHNAIIGGAPDSAHLDGEAADILVTQNDRRFKILDMAFGIGFKRIGIGENFIHLDVSTSRPRGVIWFSRKYR